MSSTTQQHISSDYPFHLQSMKLEGAEMAYIDTDPQQKQDTVVVFLHGNPTSSYLWRNIIPHVQEQARCIAPDLIGMGASSKPTGFDSRFHSHARYVELFLSRIKPSASRVILVVHDWGSALGLDWARRHNTEVLGLVLMEFIHPWPTWDDIGASDEARQLFQMFRSPEHGRRLLIEENAFIEQVLPASVIRKLTDAEMKWYRAPFRRPEDREPLYRFPNELPITGQPPDVHDAVQAYHAWLLSSPMRKLFLWVTPGALIMERDAELYTENLKNCQSVYVGEGLHYIQEDHPHAIGRLIAGWLESTGSVA